MVRSPNKGYLKVRVLFQYAHNNLTGRLFRFRVRIKEAVAAELGSTPGPSLASSLPVEGFRNVKVKVVVSAVASAVSPLSVAVLWLAVP